MRRFLPYIFISFIAFAGGFMTAAKSYSTRAEMLVGVPEDLPMPRTSYYVSETFNFIKAVDGDTLDISGPQGEVFRVRLHGIDTPERGKFYFKRAAAELTALCKDKPIRLDTIGDGKFDRVSANVHCGETFVNAALVESGAAITSIKYADSKALYALQNKAKNACKGIWAKPLNTTYTPKRLTGNSPAIGKVILTNHENCLHLTQL